MTGAAERIPALDGIRGIAVLAVVLYHAGALPLGWAGVNLFFGLSGLLITGILLDAKGTGAGFAACAGPFYIRRALRILPLAWVCVLAVAAASGQWGGALWYGSFLVNWFPHRPAPHVLDHYWSLAVEEQFYLLWPLAVFWLSRRGLAAACVGVLAIDAVFRWLLGHGGLSFATRDIFSGATLVRADPIAAGALVALLIRGPSVERRRRAVLVGFGLASAGLIAFWLARPAGLYPVFLESLLAAGIGSGILAAVLFEPRWLRQRWLVWVGTVSYGVYIFHGIIAFWFIRHFESTAARAILLVAASCLLAGVSWYGFESRILRLKRRWPLPSSGARSSESQPAAAASAPGASVARPLPR